MKVLQRIHVVEYSLLFMRSLIKIFISFKVVLMKHKIEPPNPNFVKLEEPALKYFEEASKCISSFR